jgi:hypothetical protein
MGLKDLIEFLGELFPKQPRRALIRLVAVGGAVALTLYGIVVMFSPWWNANSPSIVDSLIGASALKDTGASPPLEAREPAPVRELRASEDTTQSHRAGGKEVHATEGRNEPRGHSEANGGGSPSVAARTTTRRSGVPDGQQRSTDQQISSKIESSAVSTGNGNMAGAAINGDVHLERKDNSNSTTKSESARLAGEAESGATKPK